MKNFIGYEGIMQATNYPIQSDNETIDAVVVAVALKINDLCTAVNEHMKYVGKNRNKRDVEFDNTTEIALDQDTLVQIIQTNGYIAFFII